MDNESGYPKKKLPSHLEVFREALEDEIKAVESSGVSSTLLYRGRRIVGRPGSNWYMFNVEYLPALPPDTPCTLSIGNNQYNVTVISFMEKELIISCDQDLPDTISKATLKNGSTVLMKRLIERIEEHAGEKHLFWDKVMSREDITHSRDYSGVEISSLYKVDNKDNQNSAIIAAMTQDVTYIWGPPGTGKTTVIGQIIDATYKADSSVLVVSHTNTAVDGAIKKAYETYTKNNPKMDLLPPILRYGNCTATLKDEVTLEYHIDYLSKDLLKQEAELEERKSKNTTRRKEIGRQLLMFDWVENSELKSIHESLDSLSLLEDDVENLERECSKLRQQIQTAIQDNPEYKRYSHVRNEVDNAKVQRDDLVKKIEHQNQFLEKTPREIDRFRDEIKKHTVYDELKQKESSSFSQNHINTQIIAYANRKKELVEQLNHNKSESDRLSYQIESFERKSRFAKFLSGKREYELAIDAQEKLKAERPKIESELKRVLSLENEYQGQLNELLMLKERIKSVKPSKSKDYWVEKLTEHKQEVESVTAMLAKNTVKLERARNHIEELNHDLSIIEYIYLEIKAYEDELEDFELTCYEMSAKARRLRTACMQKLSHEKKMCISFYSDFNASDHIELFSELVVLYPIIQGQLQGLDRISLSDEDLHIRTEQRAISNELAEISRRKEEIENEVIQSCQIIGTTLTKSYLSDQLRSRDFGTVILDEASMASIPALWCASLLARTNVVIVGDFLQLPPIVMAKTDVAKKWLGTDLFYHAGVQDKKVRKNRHNIVMLNEQFRMEEDIAYIANIYYEKYTKLETDVSHPDRVEARRKFESWYPYKHETGNVRLIGTKNLDAWVTGIPRGRGHSRLNSFSAALCVKMAFHMIGEQLTKKVQVEDPLVLIVAPYRPHVDHMKKLIEAEYEWRGMDMDSSFIQVGTIHSFQGREAPIVIFDLVIDEPHWRANLFINDDEANKNLEKMFNVAITRAKFKLFVVGHFEYCLKRAKHNALGTFLRRMIDDQKIEIEDAKELFPDLNYVPNHEMSSNENLKENLVAMKDIDFDKYFLEDITHFQRVLIIYSPFLTTNRIGVLLPYFADAVSAGKRIIVVTKAPSDRRVSEKDTYNKIVKHLEETGVAVLFKKGMHEKLIFIDGEISYIGSLNCLSFSGLTGEVITRFNNVEITQGYEKMYDIEYIQNVALHSEEQYCPICGGRLQVCESPEGGIYWRCENKDFSRSKDQRYPTDGLLRCKICDSELRYFRKNEPRWICTSNPKHFQKLRQSDLRLKKMKALIPTQELKEIKKYFDEKYGNKETDNKSESEQLSLF